MNYARKRKQGLSPTSRKRYKLNNVSVEQVRRLLNTERGEAVQALYTVFDSNSISFDTLKHIGRTVEFVTFLSVSGYCFIGFGCRKLESRAAASKAALIFLVDSSHLNEYPEYRPAIQQLIHDEEDVAHTLSSFSEYIATLVVSKYEQLRKKHSLPWFKMISGIVIVEDENIRNARVIVLSTGSKCIEPTNVRMDGMAIIDSHAETLIRRSFQYFLYSQLSTANSEQTILEKKGTKSRVKPGIRLYLFVNSAPCGDSRIFTVSSKNSTQDKHPNRISRGLLRIKLDGGNSTMPLTNFEKYDPKRLMIMSCSDKLLKTNALGLQGSLLSNVVEPIYLDGIIIGNSFNESHVTRALYERLADVVLPSPFQLHHPSISGLEKNVDVISKSPKTSVNWICWDLPEIIDSTTGRTMTGQPSRLCKRNLFEKYLRLQNRLKDKHSYEDCKRESTEYLTAKKCVYQNLLSRGLGKWIERIPSFDMFRIDKHELT